MSQPSQPVPAGTKFQHRLGVVLIHGQPGDPSDWELVRDSLPKKYPVVVVERPGYGANERPAGGFIENANYLVDELNAVSIETAIVVAHSWGGAVGLALAEDHPERVHGIVLVSSVGFETVGIVDKIIGLPILGRMIVNIAMAWAIALARPELKPVVARALGERAADTMRVVLQRNQRQRLVNTFLTEQHALATELDEVMTRARLLRMPITLLHAGRDSVVSHRVARLTASRLPHARLVTLKRGGHRLPQENSDAVIHEIMHLLPDY